jgi:hypothetical protein
MPMIYEPGVLPETVSKQANASEQSVPGLRVGLAGAQ